MGEEHKGLCGGVTPQITPGTDNDTQKGDAEVQTPHIAGVGTEITGTSTIGESSKNTGATTFG